MKFELFECVEYFWLGKINTERWLTQHSKDLL